MHCFLRSGGKQRMKGKREACRVQIFWSKVSRNSAHEYYWIIQNTSLCDGYNPFFGFYVQYRLNQNFLSPCQWTSGFQSNYNVFTSLRREEKKKKGQGNKFFIKIFNFKELFFILLIWSPYIFSTKGPFFYEIMVRVCCWFTLFLMTFLGEK